MNCKYVWQQFLKIIAETFAKFKACIPLQLSATFLILTVVANY